LFRKGGCIVRGFPLFWKLYLGVLAVVFFPVVVFEMSSLLYRPAERVGIPPHIERHMEWVALSVARTAVHLLRSGDRAALSVYLDEAEEANSADFHLPEEEGFFRLCRNRCEPCLRRPPPRACSAWTGVLFS